MPFSVRTRPISLCGLLFFAVLFVGCNSQDSATKLNADTEAANTVRSVRVSLEQGKPLSTEEVQALRSVYERYPEATSVRQILKNAYVSRGEWAALEQLLKERPLSELPQDEKIMLGTVLVKTGKYTDALEVLVPLSQAEPTNVEVQALLGACYFYLDRPGEAGAAFDAVWDQIVSSKRHDEMTMRGIIYFRENKLNEALETLRQSHQLKPDHIATNNALSRVLARLGDTEQAEVFRKRTAEGQAALVESQYAASRQVTNIYEIEIAWKEKKFVDVLRIANQMLPTAAREQKVILYQYIYEANMGLGEKAAAETALAEIKRLQQSK